MALIKCDECGADVSDKAVACPKCGNPIHAPTSHVPTSPVSTAPIAPSAPPSKPPTSAGRKLGAVTGIFILAVIAFMLYEGQSTNKPAADTTTASVTGGPTVSQTPATSTSDTSVAAVSDSSPPPPPAPPVIEISAPQLFAAYKANEVLADTKFKGRWLYVTGIVNEIGKDILDKPYVTLVGEDEYEVVQAMFAKAAIQQLAQLHKGEQLSLMCQGSGKMLTNVMLDCTSDDTPPAPQHAQATTTPSPPEPAAPATQAINTPATTAPAPTPGYATSFDCTKAHSTSEMLICGDADLATLDVELAQLYTQAKAAAPDKREFANTTRLNWNWREQNCRDKECLVGWYADQKQRFTNIINQTPAAETSQTRAAILTAPQQAAPTSYATSFDCSAPTYLDEKAICGDPGLAAMDTQMAAEYAAALKRTANPTKLEADQSDWHAVRRDCASDLNCLRHSYGVRIDQLRRWQG